MRISDWSADVCSSDLGAGGRVGGAGGAAWRPGDVAVRAAAGPRAAGDRRAAQRGTGKGGRVPAVHARGHRHRGDGHRSEEHTSELQSLMRISYAVFCLKKKTTKTHNI